MNWATYTKFIIWCMICEREQELSKLSDGLGIKIFELVKEYADKIHSMEQVK